MEIEFKDENQSIDIFHLVGSSLVRDGRAVVHMPSLPEPAVEPESDVVRRRCAGRRSGKASSIATISSG